MVPQKTDSYLMWGNYYVAWPLSVPSLYADWMLVTFESCLERGRTKLVPVQELLPEEVVSITRQSLQYWGMKVANQEWALVMWRPSQSLIMRPETRTPQYDSSRSIGV